EEQADGEQRQDDGREAGGQREERQQRRAEALADERLVEHVVGEKRDPAVVRDVRRQRGEERRDRVAGEDRVSQKEHAADGERGENDPPSFGREQEHDRDRDEGVLRQQSRAERGGEAGIIVAPEGL